MLEEHKVLRVGARAARAIDVRFLAAISGISKGRGLEQRRMELPA